jgi:hypothetical protein
VSSASSEPATRAICGATDALRPKTGEQADMTSNEQQPTEPPTADDVMQAYRGYRIGKIMYLEVLARYVAAQPDQADPLFIAFAEDIALLRVLHALSVGYGWSDAIYKVGSRAQVAQAQLRGFVTRDELHGGMVLTHQGTEMLRQWTEYVVPLTDSHLRYRQLWRAVTNLEG